jgi:hypothetical protein
MKLFGYEIKHGAELAHANLAGTSRLSGVDLGFADLSNANLAESDLSDTYLKHANLSGANLLGADLIHADLSNANLSDANLQYTNLYGANLSDTKGIIVFQCKKHRLVAYKYKGVVYVKIGCIDYRLDYLLENYKAIGKENSYSDADIENYYTVLKLIEKVEW